MPPTSCVVVSDEARKLTLTKLVVVLAYGSKDAGSTPAASTNLIMAKRGPNGPWKKVEKNEQGKQCTKCHEFLSWGNFYKNKNYSDGHTYHCKSCVRKDSLTRLEKETEEENRARLKRVREYRKSLSPEKRTADKRKYLKKLKEENGERWEKYKKRRNQQKIRRLKNNPRARMMKNIRRRLSSVVKLKGGRRPASSSKTIGCSPKELYEYIENKFTEGMSWDNYGEWHIDHIKPISKHNLDDIKEVEKINHHTNLQPLWAEENINKGDSYPDETI